MSQDTEVTVGSVVFDLPNGENPKPHFKAFYGNTPVPHPTNSAAKVVNPGKVMDAVLTGK